MLFRFLWVGVIAGVLAGVPTAIIQNYTTTPLILKGEIYEHAEHAALDPESAPAGVLKAGYIRVHGGAAHEAEGEKAEWAPEDGIERTLYTSAATIITSVGFSFMLLAVMFLAGGKISPRSGLLWGIAGFAATGLAPALGLSPELPGSAAAGLLSRQIWWVVTAGMTAGGLWLILRVSSIAAIITGAVVIAVPHIIGAPEPALFTSEAPAELAGAFAASSLVLHAILWALVGVSVGFMWQRPGDYDET